MQKGQTQVASGSIPGCTAAVPGLGLNPIKFNRAEGGQDEETTGQQGDRSI